MGRSTPKCATRLRLCSDRDEGMLFLRSGLVSHQSTYDASHVRICPGRYFADTGLFINIASFLHVFDIGQPLDNAGNPIRIPHSMTDGFLSSVLRFGGGPPRTRVLILTC